ncbi:MAG: xanthine dehydrogenase family protein subunit M [Gammaproteobacteria bacterium]|nr:xanthine dehydrogenase family protein subunit M [Gammaproteobacteria bacterium]MBV8306940.1 xanthine dehydrogenase family protein subunit M [Gammaproteobacteria bacterium]MBV8405108.1 xanthine dehydrogenase family protein subunit M [Gammaproteobacteria bacterium]
MQPFEYRRAPTLDAALAEARAAATAYIAGGTNLVDYMTLGVLRPQTLVDINHLPQSYAQIDASETRLRLGALVRMSQAEEHPLIRERYPLIRDTLLLAASRQIRNMASLGGNLLQQTRCEYFRGRGFACNRREPGSGCAALEGVNRPHAVLGTSESCIATYPGDFAQALIALDATVEIAGGRGAPRRVPFASLHRLPGDTPHIQHSLAPGELITYIDVPAGPWTRRSRYVKVRDRESYEFALASAAVALQLEGEMVREARVALGGVATVPWRAREAEEVLRGAVLDESLAQRAAAAAFAAAAPRGHNAFKIPLGRETLVRALLEARSMSA